MATQWNTSDIKTQGNTSDIINHQDYLHHLNAQFAAVVLPAVVVLGVLLVTGAVGNAIVLYVYTWRMKAGTITRYIQALAVFDLFSCCLAIPGEIIDMTNNYTFGANPLCQTVRTINLFCTMASGSILIVVAIDRYKRICCPLKRQITPRCAVIIIVLCAGIALLVSLPTAVMFGGRTITTDVANINGTDCSVNDRYVTTLLPLTYSSVQMFFFLVGAVILVVLYTLIAKRIFHHAHLRQRRRSSVIIARSKPLGASTSLCSSPTQESNDQKFNFDSNTNNNNTKDFMSNSSINQGDHKTTDVLPMKTTDVHCHIKCDDHLNVIKTDRFVNEENDDKKIQSLQKFNTTDESHQRISKALTGPKNSIKIDATVIDNNGHVNKDNDSHVNIDSCSNANLITMHRFVLSRRRSSLTDLKSEQNTDTKNNLVSKSLEQLQDGFMFTNVISIPQDHIAKPKNNISEDTLHNKSPTNCPYKLSHTSPEISPPETPIEDLENPKRWLLTSHCNSGDLLWHQSRAAQGTHSLQNKEPDNKFRGINEARLVPSSLTQKSEGEKIDKSLHEKRKTIRNKISEMFQLNKVSGYDEVEISRHSFMTRASTQTFKSKEMVGFTYAVNRQHSSERRGSQTFSAGQDSKSLTLGTKLLVRSSFRGAADFKSVHTRSDTQGTRRTTLMLFSITLIYILSFLPHLVLMTLKGLDTLKLHGQSGELILNLLIRSYFINSASNPIIYSFFSKNFFKECKKVIGCFRNKE